jgi:hypothetical protein
MTDHSRFHNQTKYPRKQDFTKYNAYRKGDVHTGLTRDMVDAEFNRSDGWIIEKEADLDAYMNALDAYRLETQRLTDEFKEELERMYLHDPENPKKDLLFEKAWSHGHSSGLHEVESWYDDLSELVQ